MARQQATWIQATGIQCVVLGMAMAGAVLMPGATAQTNRNRAHSDALTATQPDAATDEGANNLGAQAIEASNFSASMDSAAKHRLLIKVETLLDREHFSPGVIDGNSGTNLRNAILAFRQAHDLSGGREVDAALLGALTNADTGPITEDYVITAKDEKGPFLGTIPTDFVEMARIKHLGYASSLQLLAEKFHTSEALLRELNPAANFSAEGTSILVVRPGDGDLSRPVARIEVDKSIDQVRALDSGHGIVAVFPATVGSTERPAPSGEWAVKSVATNPTYTYDPKRLTFGDKSAGVLTIAPGPNNPVGSTWIDLTAKTYGIHGTPDPALVGKTASHGCVRLTNWDAAALGRAVRKGTPILFVGNTDRSASGRVDHSRRRFARPRSFTHTSRA